MLRSVLLMMLVIGVTACVKKPLPVQLPENGTVKIAVDNIAGTEQLTLNTKWYVTESGDSLQISNFEFFISNIKIHTDAGKEFSVPESYHLITESVLESHSFSIVEVPFGNYTSITLTIGVDSARNVSGAQTGALDPQTGMFWDWNTGYIMAKIEGKSTSAGNISLHMGGFKGNYSAIRTVTLNIPGGLNVTQNDDKKTLHMKADVLECFKTPHTIDIAQLIQTLGTENSIYKIADNYMDMLSVDYVE